VIVFWGTWSLPARDAIEPLSMFAASLKEPGVPVIACAVRERTKDAAADFLKNFRPRHRTGEEKVDTSSLKVAGSADALARELAIARYPTFLAVDAEGKIVKRLEGLRSHQDNRRTACRRRAVRKPATARGSRVQGRLNSGIQFAPRRRFGNPVVSIGFARFSQNRALNARRFRVR
jgi:thiol-disulfide isomerase/thioredoxin